MNALQRWMFRAPIGLYRRNLGWLLGKRMLLLEHTGRKSGQTRRSVLEVTGVNDGQPIIVSGFGTGSDWYRNVIADPHVDVAWGRERFRASAVRLNHDDAVDHFDRYQRQHPKATKAIANRLRIPVDKDPVVAAEALPAFLLQRSDT